MRKWGDYQSDIKWEKFVSNTQAYVERFVDKSAERSLKVKKSLMAEFVSVFYEKLNRNTVTPEVGYENPSMFSSIKARSGC